MTSRSYFGKMNSTLGSVVPLAMFVPSFEAQLAAVPLSACFCLRHLREQGEESEGGGEEGGGGLL